jgi:hypothetical protein
MDGRANEEFLEARGASPENAVCLDLAVPISYKFGMDLPQIISRITIFFCAVFYSTLADSDAQTEGERAVPQDKVETVVCIRHGEKPLLGLGQLTCKGLNRALALPKVLLAKFGKPGFIFAPDPNQVAHDLGGEFCYVRPLATIEPAAIEYGLPVNTHFGFSDIMGLQQELTRPIYESATIFVAWEHTYLDDFVRALVKSFGGDVSRIPGWPWNDYDSIFVVRIAHGEGKTTATFSLDAEGLNNLSADCPTPMGP